MEGKELYNNEDEEKDPKSKKTEEDADDFGLPEIEDSEGKTEADPYPESWDENKESEDTYDYSDSNTDNIEPDYAYDQDDQDTEENEYRSSYYEEEYGQKKLPVGWIIFAIVVLIAIIAGVFWWLNREPEQVADPEPVVQEQIDQTPVVEEPVVEEPEPDPEPTRRAGVFEINEPTGRYHVIVASSIDRDLVHDYAAKLAKQGMMCNILAPRGNKKFHRLSVDDYASLNDATIRSEELKHTLGDDVWVIRY